MTEEWTAEEQAYFKHIEHIENIMVVLDDALEVVSDAKSRLAVIETVARAIDLEPDCLELWQHVKQKVQNETPNS